MAVDLDLLTRARVAPQSLWFEEAVALALQLGFVEVRQHGSHRIFHSRSTVNTTAAATTGPASGPRPTSSMPRRRRPDCQAARSWVSTMVVVSLES